MVVLRRRYSPPLPNGYVIILPGTAGARHVTQGTGPSAEVFEVPSNRDPFRYARWRALTDAYEAGWRAPSGAGGHLPRCDVGCRAAWRMGNVDRHGDGRSGTSTGKRAVVDVDENGEARFGRALQLVEVSPLPGGKTRS